MSIPSLSTEAQDYTLSVNVDWVAVAQALSGLNVITREAQRRQLSKDFHWYSPILAEQLSDCVADLVVKVSTEEDVLLAAKVAAQYHIPLTVRGAGTGNYGQCVPLVGGLVIDTTEMMRIIDIQPGTVTVQSGARMVDIEMSVRETGQALRMWPSTWRVATIGGFIAGGFGGIGSTWHGVLRDSGNLKHCRVVTVEHEPKIIELVDENIQKVHHAYGTNGIITQVTLGLSPAVEWVHCIALFSNYRQTLDCAIAASTPEVKAFLLSTVDARFAPYYKALKEHFPVEKHALFAMIAPESLALFTELVRQHGGTISLSMSESELEAAELPPAYDCAYNHTTLQALKVDKSWTYLQVAYPQPFDPRIVDKHLARYGDDIFQHHEFARMHDEYATFAILLVRWQGYDHQYKLIAEIEADGCIIFNPHVVTIEEGGMKEIDTAQIDFKKRADPMGLMNPGKTSGWTAEMAQKPDSNSPNPHA